MNAAEFPLDIEQGAAYEATFEWRDEGTPRNLTGWTARAQIRPKPGGDLTLDLTPFLQVQPGGQVGRVRLLIPADATTGLTRDGVWDLLLELSPTNRVRLVRGAVRVSKAVTVVP